jgi:hypothetical protein
MIARLLAAGIANEYMRAAPRSMDFWLPSTFITVARSRALWPHISTTKRRGKQSKPMSVNSGRRTVTRRNEDWGQLGPAMKALPNDRWRDFVRAMVTQRPGHGSLTRAARAAGFGKNSKGATLAKFAHNLSRDDRMIAAIAEESKKILRIGHPEAVNAALAVIRDPSHKDHGRMVTALLDRVDPIVSRHDIEVVHRVVDPDREALEELRALRQLGTPREKLIELFGHNGLDRIETLDTADTARRAEEAKVIDGEVIKRRRISNER